MDEKLVELVKKREEASAALDTAIKAAEGRAPYKAAQKAYEDDIRMYQQSFEIGRAHV